MSEVWYLELSSSIKQLSSTSSAVLHDSSMAFVVVPCFCLAKLNSSMYFGAITFIWWRKLGGELLHGFSKSWICTTLAWHLNQSLVSAVLWFNLIAIKISMEKPNVWTALQWWATGSDSRTAQEKGFMFQIWPLKLELKAGCDPWWWSWLKEAHP